MHHQRITRKSNASHQSPTTATRRRRLQWAPQTPSVHRLQSLSPNSSNTSLSKMFSSCFFQVVLQENVEREADLEMGETNIQKESVQTQPPNASHMSRMQRLSATNPLRLVMDNATRVASPSPARPPPRPSPAQPPPPLSQPRGLSSPPPAEPPPPPLQTRSTPTTQVKIEIEITPIIKQRIIFLTYALLFPLTSNRW